MKYRSYILWALSIVSACIVWAIDYSFLRWSLYEHDPLLIVSAEHIFWIILATIIFVWVSKNTSWHKLKSFVTRVKTIPKKAWAALFLIALLWWVLATYALTTSLFLVQYDNLALPAVFQKTQPLFAVLWAMILLWEKINWRFFVILLTVLLWSYLVTFWLAAPNIGEDKIYLASLWALLAAACWWLQTVFARYVSRYLEFYEIAWMRIFLTAIIATIIVLGRWWVWDLIYILHTHRQTLFFIALLSWIGAIGLYYFGIRRVPASQATIYELSLPVSLEIFTLVSWVWVAFSISERIGVIIITLSMFYFISKG